MTHPTKPTAGPPALSSPVEDDKARAEKLWNGLHRAEDDPWCDDQDKLAIAVEFARIRAEAVAAERGTGSLAVGRALAALADEECENGIEAIGETCSWIDPDQDESDAYRFEHWCGPCIAKALLADGFDGARGPALAQQEETHEKD